MSQFTFAVPGVSCDHCKSTIEGQVSELPGVTSVEVDLAAKRVSVDGDASSEAIVAAINEAGYEVAGAAA